MVLNLHALVSFILPRRANRLGEQGPLRILQMCSSSATSGAERHVYSLTTNLHRRGHHVQVVTPTTGWLSTILSDAQVPVTFTQMKGLGWWRTMALVARQVRRDKIDVVHTHLTRAAYIGHAIGIVTRVPIVTSVHIANNDQIYRRLARRGNRLVAVSNFVAGMLHGRGVPKRFIDTVYNGTDFADIDPVTKPEEVKAEFDIPQHRRIVGLVGKVCRDKGQVELIHAMGAIKSEHPDAHL